MSAVKGFIPNGQRPTLVAPEKPTVILEPLHERERKSHWLESRLVFALAVAATLLAMGIFVGFVAGFLLEIYR